MASLARYPARACWRVRYTLSLGGRRRSRARYCKTKAAATALTTRLADLERATCDQIASNDSRPARAATIPTVIAATSILVSTTPWRSPGRTAAFCIRPIPLSRPLPSTTVTSNAAQADALGDGSESCHVYRYGGGQGLAGLRPGYRRFAPAFGLFPHRASGPPLLRELPAGLAGGRSRDETRIGSKTGGCAHESFFAEG